MLFLYVPFMMLPSLHRLFSHFGSARTLADAMAREDETMGLNTKWHHESDFQPRTIEYSNVNAQTYTDYCICKGSAYDARGVEKLDVGGCHLLHHAIRQARTVPSFLPVVATVRFVKACGITEWRLQLGFPAR